MLLSFGLKFLRLLGTLSIGVALGLIGVSRSWFSAPPTASPISIERIVELSNLLTLRVDVADVQITRIDGMTGGVSVAVLIKGDAALGIDLSQARLENVDPMKRTAILVLPPPQVAYARVDHDRTRLFALSADGLWSITPGTQDYMAVFDKAMEAAQTAVASVAQSQDADDHARQHAVNLLLAFLRSMNWEIQVRWSDRPTSGSASSAANDGTWNYRQSENVMRAFFLYLSRTDATDAAGYPKRTDLTLTSRGVSLNMVDATLPSINANTVMSVHCRLTMSQQRP